MLNFRSSVLPLTVLLAVGAVARLSAQNDLDVPANTKVTLNESAAYQNITVGTGATLETIDANSGGGGDHAITVTFAASGAGTIQNDGTIELFGNDQGNTTVFANPVTLSGSGTLELLNTYGFNDASVQGPGTVTQAAGHTLIGGGGDTDGTGPLFSAPLVNNGLVTTSNLGFVLNGASLVNNGTFSASNGSALHLDAPTLDNTNGTITVGDANSVVLIENGVAVSGGTLASTVPGTVGNDYGVFRLQGGASLANLIIATTAGVKVEDTGALAGTITNDGFLLVPGDFTLNLAGNVTLAGSGTLYLGGHLEGANNATLTINPGQELQLQGNANASGPPDIIDASVVNNGTLAGTYVSGLINSPVFTNNGVLAAENNASVSVSGTTNFTNFGVDSASAMRISIESRLASGQIKKQDAGGGTLTGGTYTVTDQGNGATLDLGGRSVAVNASAITLSGPNANFSAINGLVDNQGAFSLLAQKVFSTVGALSNEGTIALDAGSTLQVNGNFTASNTAKLAVTVGGAASQGAGSSGILQASGAVVLSGTLAVTLAPGAALPDASESMSFLSAGSGITGSFSNVASGTRIATTDGQGSFLINYGANSNLVTVSSFAASGTTTHLAFFTGETALANGVYYLAFPGGNYFGYYSFLANPAYLYHFDLGFEYVFDAADGKSGVYFYDFASNDFFYTSPSFPFPYLYDFNMNTVLYYYPDPNNAGHYNTNGVRYFYDFATGQIITK